MALSSRIQAWLGHPLGFTSTLVLIFGIVLAPAWLFFDPLSYIPRDPLGGGEGFGLIDKSHDAYAADLRHRTEPVNHGGSAIAFSQAFAVHPVETRLDCLAAERAAFACRRGILWRREKETPIVG